jgi:hypothetical protein
MAIVWVASVPAIRTSGINRLITAANGNTSSTAGQRMPHVFTVILLLLVFTEHGEIIRISKSESTQAAFVFKAYTTKIRF